MSDDEDLENLSGAELGAALMRKQTEKRRRKEQILEDQVRELRELRQSDDEANSVRIKHLLLLEECNSMWDILPLSKAINCLQDNPAPHITGVRSATDADKQAYELAISFEIGSDEWCFVILLLHQKFQCMYDYDDNREQYPLLLKDQSSKDACIENGLVCGQCLKVSPPRRCTRCKMLRYCNSDCQSTHWKEHKKQCRPERLKPSDDYDRSTRKRYCEENGAAITYVREHPYPATVENVRFFIGPTPSYYTEGIHKEFEKVYNMIGKNTFKVYGREFGMLLYEYGQTLNHGGRGMDVLHSAQRVFLKVVSGFPILSDDPEREKSQFMIAEVLARRLLSSSWDGIGDWDS